MPQRRVEVDSFWIDRTEVNNQQYARCVAQGACTPPASYSSKDREDYYQNPEYADYPVIHISWEQAQQYCTWTERRLPTEAEWEKAARGSTGQVYPWGWVGSSMGSRGVRANYCDSNCSYEYRDEGVDDGYDETAPSDSFQTGASPFGALNMAGNVWEWVADWYESDYYQTAPDENPTGPPTGLLKVIRGGSWMDQAWLGTVFGLRAANRAAHEPQTGEFYLGFRCALSP
jgi:formylglycine-generating enzyme required for sulfatase activity